MRTNTLGAALHTFLVANNSEANIEDTKASCESVFELLIGLPEGNQEIIKKVFTEDNQVLEDVMVFKFKDGSYLGLTNPEKPPMMLTYGDLENLVIN